MIAPHAAQAATAGKRGSSSTPGIVGGREGPLHRGVGHGQALHGEGHDHAAGLFGRSGLDRPVERVL